MINALTGKVESAQNHMSGNPTYQALTQNPNANRAGYLV